MIDHSIIPKYCVASGGEFNECHPKGCDECKYFEGVPLEYTIKCRIKEDVYVKLVNIIFDKTKSLMIS